MESNAYLTVEEFAKELRVSEQTIRRAIKRKKIIALRPGGRDKSPYRIPRIELDRLALKEMYDN